MNLDEINKNKQILMNHFNNNCGLVIDYLIILHGARDSSSRRTANIIKAVHNVDVSNFLNYDTSKVINDFMTNNTDKKEA